MCVSGSNLSKHWIAPETCMHYAPGTAFILFGSAHKRRFSPCYPASPIGLPSFRRAQYIACRALIPRSFPIFIVCTFKGSICLQAATETRNAGVPQVNQYLCLPASRPGITSSIPAGAAICRCASPRRRHHTDAGPGMQGYPVYARAAFHLFIITRVPGLNHRCRGSLAPPAFLQWWACP
jgi:hypothetical protein